MTRGRMEAFSDGVLAIVITIMVLELDTPSDTTLRGVYQMLPTVLAYLLSYVYIGIYWSNHHHLLATIKTVSAPILGKNLVWLFWVSLIPIATEWTGLNPFSEIPTVMYGRILLMCAISYHLLQSAIVKENGENSELAKNIGDDRKGKISIAAYSAATAISFFSPAIAYIVYASLAVMWIIPDKRVEESIEEEEKKSNDDNHEHASVGEESI